MSKAKRMRQSLARRENVQAYVRRLVEVGRLTREKAGRHL